MLDSNDGKILKRELLAMFGHIQRIRQELAAIRLPSTDDQDHFANMADQLDAIVEATEDATNTIMTNMEEIEGLIGEAKTRVADPGAGKLLDQMTDKVNAVFEACSFQDLTGQRVTKVVKSLQYIEERVNAIIRTWGRDELEKVVLDLNEHDPDKALLHGPQRKGHGVSQSEVDKLLEEPKIAFSQDDIDKLFG